MRKHQLSHADGALARTVQTCLRLTNLLDGLFGFVVLPPACGCLCVKDHTPVYVLVEVGR